MILKEQEILEHIETIVKGMERDNVKLKIDIIGSLTKLMYLVADEDKVQDIINNYTNKDK
jgi:hypothetical protein